MELRSIGSAQYSNHAPWKEREKRRCFHLSSGRLVIVTVMAAIVLVSCLSFSVLMTMTMIESTSHHTIHRPFNFQPSTFYEGRVVKTTSFTASSTVDQRQQSHKNDYLRLRYDWTDLSPSLDRTRDILRHQSNCSIPVSTFAFRNRFGLGSDLHVYSQALANGIEANRRIRTVGNWTWMDRNRCATLPMPMSMAETNNDSPLSLLGSPMRCYFAVSELNCPGDVEFAIEHPEFDPDHSLSKANGNVRVPSEGYSSPILPSKNDRDGGQQWTTAVVESLFTKVTPLVVKEAERQLNLVFGVNGKVPKDLITVHIRWGDKVTTYYEGKKRNRYPEMKKVDIPDYIDAVHQILEKRNNDETNAQNKKANIYLATEDPKAVEEFQKALPDGWNLYLDQYLVETTHHRIDEYNGGPKMAKELNGRAGLLALGSLLVAMEANGFVLTTASNWSQLMDELRRSILDSRCQNCTSLVDLRR